MTPSFQQALGFHQQGQLAQAEAIYRQILQAEPLHIDALAHLCLVLGAGARYDELLVHSTKLLQQQADHVPGLLAHGIALRQLGRADEALADIDRVLSLAPGHADALLQRGMLLRETKQFDAALACYREFLVSFPDHPDALYNCANVLQDLNQHQAALRHYDAALRQRPGHAATWTNRGNSLQVLQRYQEALNSYDSALSHRPDHVGALYNRGNTLQSLQRHQDALDAYAQVQAITPEHVDANSNESLCRLMLGDYPAGWKKYEWRWQTEAMRATRREFKQALWLGSESLHGKTILLHAEQGLGDTLQFCRYASLVAEQGARVLLQVQPALKSLMAGLAGVAQVFADGKEVPPFDYHCPLLSLPLALHSDLGNLPRRMPYLTAEAESLRRIGGALAATGEALKIGVCWQGGNAYLRDAERSIGLRPFQDWFAALAAERLAGRREAVFYTLLPNSREPFLRAGGQDIGHELDQAGPPFAETAALIMHLDLVVTCDTAVGHLAAALGKPVWLLLAHGADWRWMTRREDSPWYPNTRIIRQTAPGDWAGVFERLAVRLRKVQNGDCEVVWPV